MIISTDTEKAFDKIQYSFMIKKKKNCQQISNGKQAPQQNKAHI